MIPIYIYTLFSISTYICVDYYIYAPYIMYVRRRFALPCNVSDIRCSTYNIYICLQSIYTLFSIIIYTWIHYYMYALHIMYVCRTFALPCNAVTLYVQHTINITNIYMPPIYILFFVIIYIYGSTIICMGFVSPCIFA